MQCFVTRANDAGICWPSRDSRRHRAYSENDFIRRELLEHASRPGDDHSSRSGQGGAPQQDGCLSRAEQALDACPQRLQDFILARLNLSPVRDRSGGHFESHRRRMLDAMH